MVVGAAPVGNDSTIEAPLLAQDIHQKMMVFVGVGVVHLIIRRHDGFGAGFLYHDLEGGEVQLPQGALVQHRVACHAAQFLTVGGKVLGTGCHTVCLNAPDIGGCHFAGEVGVLGEILKAASAQGAALQVQPRTQQDVDPVCGGLLAQCPAYFFAQRRVPAVCHGGGGGKAGGRHGGVQAQMVGCARLLPQTVRAVRKPRGRHALLGILLRLPCVLTREQGAFLFKGKLCDNILMLHGKAPFCGNVISFGSRTTPDGGTP